MQCATALLLSMPCTGLQARSLISPAPGDRLSSLQVFLTVPMRVSAHQGTQGPAVHSISFAGLTYALNLALHCPAS